jgi:uncharacterized SAM-binding protein YcdF (DUF218 family)
MPHWISYSSLIPPALFILLAMLGVALAWRWRRGGLLLATVGVACLYIAATPLASYLLMRAAVGIAAAVPVLRSPAPPGAVIVLSAGYRHSSRPDGRDTVDRLGLERLAEAARAERRTGLPLLVSGGRLKNADASLAAMMAEVLENDFRVPVRWCEDRSHTTYENALYSVQILRRAGIGSALVVTDRWHMARALWSFYAVGYPVIAAPIPERLSLQPAPSMILPQIPALMSSYYALHELIGLAWYVARYRPH